MASLQQEYNAQSLILLNIDNITTSQTAAFFDRS